MQSIPRELIPSILSFLDSDYLAKSSLVCKTWHAYGENLWQPVITNELKRKKYSARVFGPKEWESIYGITTLLPYPRNLCKELDKPSPFFPQKTVGETSFIQCKVKEIDNCATLELKTQSKIGYFKINNSFNKNKEIASGTADWYIIPETILPMSTNKTLGDQIFQIIEQDPSYRAASIFEISLVAFNHFLLTNQYLLNRSPPLYTRAVSTIQVNHFHIVGAFYEFNGLTVTDLNPKTQMRNVGIIPLKELL